MLPSTPQSMAITETLRRDRCLRRGPCKDAIFSIRQFFEHSPRKRKGVIQIFQCGRERMLGFAAARRRNKITPADISDPQ